MPGIVEKNRRKILGLAARPRPATGVGDGGGNDQARTGVRVPIGGQNQPRLTKLADLNLKTSRPALLLALEDIGDGHRCQPCAPFRSRLGEHGVAPG